MRNLRITCEAKSNDKAKSNDDETKANFNKKSSLQNTTSDKISCKMPTFITISQHKL